jgi:CubicO group peptidase (beta-lactamase class C family)
MSVEVKLVRTYHTGKSVIDRRSLLSAIAVATACAGAPLANDASTRRHDIRITHPRADEIDHMLDVARVPALTYAVIENGRLTEMAVRGFRKERKAATAQTFFDSASLAKPVFAAAALRLADEGVLDLDRPLQSYMPVFQDARAQAITARHVLSHSTGLPNWHFSEEPIAARFAPGTQWGYSGEAHFILLRVIEHLTGKTLAALLDEHVIRPAGMVRSSIVWTSEVAADNAWPHDNFGDPVDDRFITQRISMVRFEYARKAEIDMARWTTEDALQACKANGEDPYPGNAIPNPAFGLWTNAGDYARFLIHAAQDNRRAQPQIRMRGNLAWALGWGLELGAAGPFAWHHGDAGGVKNFFMLHLPSCSGVVVFGNGENAIRIYRRMTRQIFSREFDAFLWV